MGDFKVGERVKIDKTVYVYPQDRGTISEVFPNYYHVQIDEISDFGYHFTSSQLEHIDEKEKTMKWKIKKELTLGGLIEGSDISMQELQRLVTHLFNQGNNGPQGNILDIYLIEYAEKHDCFIKFLKEEGYVEKVESAHNMWIADCPTKERTSEFVAWAELMPNK